MASVVRVEQTESQVRLGSPSGGRQFDTLDEIYLCNVLPGERSDRDGIIIHTFDAEVLGRSGIAELCDYLTGKGFQLQLDAQTRNSIDKITSEKSELTEAKRRGSRLKQNPTSQPQVVGFKRTLKPFQVPAVGHMLGVSHAANFSVPGSGKTTIALATFAELKANGKAQTLVVVGPRSSFAPWESELAACLGGAPRSIRIAGTQLQRRRAWRTAHKATLVLMNYHAAASDSRALSEFLASRACMLVLDESHHVKNISDSKWSTAVRKVAPLATKRVILSGTPAPNSLLDLWSQFTFLYPGAMALGTRDEFLNRIEQSGPNATRDVRDTISPLFWRITKGDLLLPKPKITKLSIKLGEVQSAIYDALAGRVLTDSHRAPKELAKLKAWRRAKMVRLLQAASNPSLLAKYSHEFRLPPLSASGLPVSQLIDRYSDYEVPAKIRYAVALLRKLISKHRKVVVWTSFVHNIETLLKLLDDVSPLPLYGAIPASRAEDAEVNREEIIEKFLHYPSSPVLIANPAACAESISLHTACHDALYLDRSFNAAHFLQSKDRIHRVGLKPTNRINYYLLIASNTIDEVVDMRLDVKQRKLLQLLETDLATVNLDSPEDVVSEDADEEIDFRETLKQITKLAKRDR